MQAEDEDLTISDEWKYIALIIDHLLLYIYCFFAFFGTFYYFWSIGKFIFLLIFRINFLNGLLNVINLKLFFRLHRNFLLTIMRRYWRMELL